MFTVESVTNLQWANEEHTSFSCVVKYAQFNEEHPAGINATDSYAHIQEIWTKANAGDYGVIAEYVPPEIPPIPEPAENQPITKGTQTI
jgi:UDP-3-O-[3-hydroxymyristoyl] glucosamine N-acyltransferase